MSKSKRYLSEYARNNKTVLNTHLIDVVVMTFFCVLQVVGGLAPWTYAAFVAVLGLAPVIVEFILWKRNSETKIVKYLAPIGFAVFYIYTMYTTTNMLVFVFVIPMILVASIYNDTRYSLMINLVAVLVNLCFVIGGSSTGKFGFLGMDYAIIQVVCMILIGVFSFLTSKTLRLNSNQKLANVEEAQQQTEVVLTNMSSLSEKVQAGIADIYTELEKLSEASQVTKSAMQELSDGATDTASAVQSQFAQTEAIGDKAALVNTAAESIKEHMKQTLLALDSGNRDVTLLIEHVDASVQNGADVANKLQTLDQYIKEMNTIVELISGIAKKTGLLSLNASIEAARAGEAGRGFSVVASEISSMATQTNDATTQIADLIANISSAIKEVVAVIYHMIDGIQEEKKSTTDTAESFGAIKTNTFSIRDNIEELSQHIAALEDANRTIADSVNTISSITEEVSAHASQTMQAEENNTNAVALINRKMQGLMELFQK